MSSRMFQSSPASSSVSPDILPDNLPDNLLSQACLNSLADLIYIVDVRGVILYINPTGAALLGYDIDAIVGLHFLDILMPSMRLRAGHAFAQLLSRGQLSNTQFELCTRSGAAVPIQVNGRRLMVDGAFRGFTGVGRVMDASDGESSLNAIAPSPAAVPARSESSKLEPTQSSDEIFRAYIEAANDIVYTLDLRGKFTFLNDYGLQLFGYPKAEILDRYYLDFVAPESQEATAIAFADLLETGELRDYEFIMEQADGNPVFLEVNGRLLYQDGELIGGLGIGRDITERKRVEQQLKMLSNALDAAYDSAIITDLDGIICYANQATQRVFGYDLSDLLNHNVSRLYPDPTQSPWLIEQAKRGGWSGQVICQDRDASILTALVSVGPVCNESGAATAVSIIYRDITQLENIKAELSAKNLELQRASQMKSLFLANMSHELRTPMTSILGFSSLLEQGLFGPLNERQMLYVQQIYQSGDHLLTLINEVLDLSKIEAGQMQLNLAPVELESLCHDALSMVSAQATAKNLSVHQNLSSDLPSIIGDELRLRQMLLNLLSNAIKFSEEGSDIGVDIYAVSRQLSITVWDHGIGIPLEQQSQLFQPFQQLDSALSRRHEGTGLGLTLTRHLAQLHGGDVSLRSSPGDGSRFTIWLPLNSAAVIDNGKPAVELSSDCPPAAQPDSSRLSLPDTAENSETPKGIILIVEDHPINAILLEHMLTYWGYQTAHVVNGEDTLDWLGCHRPVLILMDIHLPEMDGLALTQKIRQTPEWQDIPIVATTALVMEGDRDRCLAVGMQDYLSKPINSVDLVSVLAEHT